MSDLSRLSRIYRGEAARLLDTYPNTRAQGPLHSLDDMIVKDLARTYPTAPGRELQRAMIEGSPHIHERKSWHIDDYTRRPVRKAWESLGREPEPWMRAEGAAVRQPGPSRHRDWTRCSDDAGGPAAGARGAGARPGRQGRRGTRPRGARP